MSSYSPYQTVQRPWDPEMANKVDYTQQMNPGVLQTAMSQYGQPQQAGQAQTLPSLPAITQAQPRQPSRTYGPAANAQMSTGFTQTPSSQQPQQAVQQQPQATPRQLQPNTAIMAATESTPTTSGVSTPIPGDRTAGIGSQNLQQMGQMGSGINTSSILTKTRGSDAPLEGQDPDLWEQGLYRNNPTTGYGTGIDGNSNAAGGKVWSDINSTGENQEDQRELAYKNHQPNPYKQDGKIIPGHELDARLWDAANPPYFSDPYSKWYNPDFEPFTGNPGEFKVSGPGDVGQFKPSPEYLQWLDQQKASAEKRRNDFMSEAYDLGVDPWEYIKQQNIQEEKNYWKDQATASKAEGTLDANFNPITEDGTGGETTESGTPTTQTGTSQYTPDQIAYIEREAEREQKKGQVGPATKKLAEITAQGAYQDTGAPSEAELLMRQGFDQQAAIAASIAASNPSINPAVAQRLAQRQLASGGQQLSSQLGILRTREDQLRQAQIEERRLGELQIASQNIQNETQRELAMMGYAQQALQLQAQIDQYNKQIEAQKDSKFWGLIGTGLGVIGGVVGGIYGGPAGAAVGYSSGRAVGQAGQSITTQVQY